MTETSNEETRRETDESTNPNAPEESDNAGIKGQILYPDREVDAERAAAFAGGKEETLYDEDDPRNQGWTNPADRSGEVLTGETGDETGEETEPTENPDYDPNDPVHHP